MRLSELSMEILEQIAVLGESNPRRRNTVARSLGMCNRFLWSITLAIRFRSVELLDMNDAYETADMLAVCNAIGLVKVLYIGSLDWTPRNNPWALPQADDDLPMDSFASVRECYVATLMPDNHLERVLRPCVALESLTVYGASRHDFILIPANFSKLKSITLRLMSEFEEEDVYDGIPIRYNDLHLNLSPFSLTTLHIIDNQDGDGRTSPTMNLLYSMDFPPTLRSIALEDVLPDPALMEFLARHWLQFDDVEIKISSMAELNHHTNGYLLDAVVEFLLKGTPPTYQFLTDSKLPHSRPSPLIVCYGFGYRSIRLKDTRYVKALGLGFESITQFDDPVGACPLAPAIRQLLALSELEELHIQLTQWPWGDIKDGILELPEMLSECLDSLANFEMLQSLLLGWKPGMFQSVWPYMPRARVHSYFPKPEFGRSLLYSPSPPVTLRRITHTRPPYSIDPFSIADLSDETHETVYDTLRHMQALLPEECAYLQPDLFRSYVEDEPRLPYKQAIIDSFSPTGVRVDTFESHLIRAWVKQRRADLKIGLSGLWTRCPSLRHLVHFTHPATRAFYWIAHRDSQESDARVRFRAYVDQETQAIVDFGGQPSFSVGGWLEKWWLGEQERLYEEVRSF